MAEYFFELLTEEIPAWMHDAARTTLEQQLTKAISDLAGSPAVTVNTTPRRIIFFLSALPLREADREEEIKGPPRRAAYDGKGQPTQALHGFLRKNNATPADILADGDYVRIRRKVAGRAADALLQACVPGIVEGLRWPKMMRWGNGEHAYIRPVHSILSMFEGRHLPLSEYSLALGST